MIPLNPYLAGLGHILNAILGPKAGQFKNAVERVASSIATESDYKDLAQMFVAIYETGFIKAVEAHQEGLRKLGLAAKIVPQESEKSG